MNILQITMSIFLLLETLNILVLYKYPQMDKGNGLGVFKSYKKIEEQQEHYLYMRYLINWVANAKVIFVMLGVIIVIFGSETIQLYTSIALILSILMFYITLNPIIKKLDQENKLTIKGYSKTLSVMISSFIVILLVGIIVHII